MAEIGLIQVPEGHVVQAWHVMRSAFGDRLAVALGSVGTVHDTGKRRPRQPRVLLIDSVPWWYGHVHGVAACAGGDILGATRGDVIAKYRVEDVVEHRQMPVIVNECDPRGPVQAVIRPVGDTASEGECAGQVCRRTHANWDACAAQPRGEGRGEGCAIDIRELVGAGVIAR